MKSQTALVSILFGVAMTFACSDASTRGAAPLGPSWEEARADATTTSIDGIEIRYRRSPRADAPSVVLFGPYPQSIRAWDSAWSALAGRYDLLAMDLPGFGLSDGSPETMSPSAAARVALRVADHFGIDRFHVVGPDVGAPVALWLAANHADRILSANVFDGPGYFPPAMEPQLDRLVHSGLYRWMAGHVVAGAAMDQFFEIATETGYAVAEPSAAARAEYYAITHDPRAHRLSLAFLASYETELTTLGGLLPEISTPVLVTWGREDAFVLPENAERLHELLPSSELVLFDDAGHYSHEDAGDRYVDVLTSWIDGGYVAAAAARADVAQGLGRE